MTGTTHYPYQLNEEATIYDSSIKNGYNQALFEVGEEVTIRYSNVEESLKTVIEINK